MSQGASSVAPSVLERTAFFTGALPADSVEAVFRTMASAVGPRALAYPDGEINERRYWIIALKDTVWSRCGGIEMIPSQMPKEEQDVFPSFGLKAGVSEVRLDGLLPYSNAAIQSYEIFKRLRDDGVIDPAVRFQIAIPAALDAIALYFPDAESWPILFRAWTRAIQDELYRMLEVIPAEDLLVQIDYCLEVAFIDGALAEHLHWVRPEMTGDDAFARYTSRAYAAAHLEGVPEEVMAGYHICLGTFPVWPRVPIDDIGLPVDLANALAANSGRRVDFFHLPVMPDADERFFAPLERLDVGDAAIYLGVECNDGSEAMKRRMADARKMLTRFGVSHYCGYSWNAEILPQLLIDLRDGADEQAAAMGAR